MSENLDLQSAIDIAMSAMQNSSDFSDPRSVASFMIFASHITEHPEDVLSCNDLDKLAVVASTILATDFVQKYPNYNGVSQGIVLSAVGFYAFMKQIDMGTLKKSRIAAFVVLLHEGRKYLEDIVEAMQLSSSGVSASVYNPLFMMDYNGVQNEKKAIVKGIELLMHIHCEKVGYADEYTSVWMRQLKSEQDSIERLAGRNHFKNADKIFEYLSKKLASSSPYDFSY